MPGMVDIITVVMEIEQTKKNIINFVASDEKGLLKKICIAMVAIIAIIAIILVDLILKSNKTHSENISIARDSINIRECDDEEIIKFINNYFKAKNELNYVRIFSSYGRDFYKEERESKDDKSGGNFKKIVDSIKYEKVFVRNYENIKVYYDKGYREDEVICVVTYDTVMGFTDNSAPMIIIFYLQKNNENYVIKGNLDVGTSKYIVECTKTDIVKNLYKDITQRLNRAIVSSESMKLAYNSLRQIEMNLVSDLGNTSQNAELNFGIKHLDMYKDVEEINSIMRKEKDRENAKKAVDEYMNKVIASYSTVKK